MIFRLHFLFLPGIPESLSSGGWSGFGLRLCFPLILILSLFSSHLYSLRNCFYPVDLIKSIIPPFFLSLVICATFAFFVPQLSILNWRIFPPLLTIFAIIFLFRFYLVFCMEKNRKRILIIGAARLAKDIIETSKDKKFKGYHIAGALTFMKSRENQEIFGVPVFGPSIDFEKIVQENRIEIIVVTLRDRRGKLPVFELLKSKMDNIEVMEGFTFYEKVKRKIIIDDFLKPSWFIFQGGFFHTSLHSSIKRAQGVLISFILLTILSPVLLLISILIKLESEGPVFYIQERVGKKGKVFRLLKFRSMGQNAETSGATFAVKNDPRVTRLGGFLRKVRLDEVPQFINIFKGDMDMVGPRPERPSFVEQLEEKVPYYSLRHTVRPGLTGWAQVNYPYGENFSDSREKLKYDLYYVKHFSWYLDLFILVMTIREVVFVRGR